MKSRIRNAIAVLGIAFGAVAVPPAVAAPTAQINGGYTLVEFLPDFVNALTSLGIAPSKTLPATLYQRIGYFVGHPTLIAAGQAGAARIEAARRVFPACWFNADTTEPGRDALGWYHEKQDAQRNIGLGPEHDWSSHAADGFGLMAVYSETALAVTPQRPAPRPQARDWRL